MLVEKAHIVFYDAIAGILEQHERNCINMGANLGKNCTPVLV